MAEQGGGFPVELGFPEGFQLFELVGDEKGGGIGLNTKAQRPAIGEQQASWIENFLPIGPANTRTIYGANTAIYSSATIVNVCFYNIGATAYSIVFNTDGSAKQIQLSNGAVTTVGAAGTFFNPADACTPTIAQWAASGILIVSQTNANAYWAWDGTLHSPGDATSPAWLNGGTASPMPTGVAGSDIEIFLSRVWIVNGTNILTSVASNGADFAAGHGGLIKPNTDSSLRVRYTGIRQSNGYLYVFGDSECAYITNVQTSTVPTTTYQYTVIDAQIGTPWRDSMQAYGRALLFANSNGIYALYGSAANKISDDLDGIWNDTVADFLTVIPSAAVATLFGIKCFLITVRTTDPTTGTVRNLMAGFDGKKWFIATQNPEPLIIATQETNSHLEAWGTDGFRLFDLFVKPDPTLTKKIASKLWGGSFGFVCKKQATRFYTEVDRINNANVNLSLMIDTDEASVAGTISANQGITFVNNSGGVLQFQNNSAGNLFFQTQGSISVNETSAFGYLLGFTITTTSPDFVLERAAMGYVPNAALY